MIDIDDDGVIANPRACFVRTPYNYDADDVSRETGLECGEESKTQQQFRDECDINTIVRNFGVTGELPQGVRLPVMADFEDALDYQSAMNVLLEAEKGFMAFPAEIRARFQNDPGRFIAFAEDPANLKQMQEWGYGKPQEPRPGPLEVRVVPDPVAPPQGAPGGGGTVST